MNVRLATQLFSRSVSIGLKVYRQMMVPGFADSFGTEQFTMLLNDLFDILNSKVPAAGIRKGSPKIKFLDDFLAMLNETESIPNVKLFASRQTIESLRVTLMSVLSLVEFLFNQGVSYILTASLNQDPLEVTVSLPSCFLFQLLIITVVKLKLLALQRFFGLSLAMTVTPFADERITTGPMPASYKTIFAFSVCTDCAVVAFV
ncbi:uncharacterized protein LOC144116053 [Amblyomma americanum]